MFPFIVNCETVNQREEKQTFKKVKYFSMHPTSHINRH